MANKKVMANALENIKEMANVKVMTNALKKGFVKGIAKKVILRY